MPEFRKATPKNLPNVFERILAMDPESKRMFVDDFNEFLDGLLEQDFFGTEGQCDPRGDHRS